jgi:hypothetical protein
MSMKKIVKSKKRPYVIVRAREAGVHAGELVSRKGTEVVLKDSRRIWYWKGAASLSELAIYGAKDEPACRFGVCLPEITVLGVCEVIPCSKEGESMIRRCREWRA